MATFAGSGLNSLATIIKRLEAATARLEDITTEQSRQLQYPDARDSADAPAVATPSVTATAVPQSAPPPPPVTEEPKSVVAFDEDVIQAKLQPFVELTKSFAHATLVEQVELLAHEYNDLRAFIRMAATCQKPDGKEFGDLLGPLQKDIAAVAHFVETHRQQRDWLNHFQAMSSAAPFAGWVAGDMKPGPYIEEMKNSMVFYGHKVIKEFKEKEPKHVEWVRAFTALLDQTRAYVVEHHTTGLVWNPKGIPVAQYNAQQKDGAAGSAPPPPPPPPPPAPGPAPPAPAPSAGAGGAAAVFAELNKGEAVTQGLRKVDKSEMTHKNPSLRANSVVPASPPAGKKPTRPAKPAALSGRKPPKFALEGTKWMLEYQENETNLVIEDGQINQTVNLFGLKGCVVQVKGKVNGVSLLNCTKTSVLVDSVISAISVTKSPSFTLQITGSAPTVQIDSTDQGQIYLSKSCLGVEITTAKCSSINVSLPVEGEEDGVFEEQPMPEMMKTTIVNGKLATVIVEHVG